ncbi:MAG: hypothetical protein H6622_14275 [Halobacteriovoraceae bacterium]|nr:hypothetical protein [Halobacteriovoraceae bacterium]
MTKKVFQAGSWLGNSYSSSVKQEFHSSTPIYKSENAMPFNQRFEFKNFIIPEWHGDSLISKNALAIRKNLITFYNDAKKQFSCFHGLNKSLKDSIYTEYLSYIEERQTPKLNQFDFWKNIQNESIGQHTAVNEFIKFYCFRAATFYLYKIRFLSKLCHQIKLFPTENNLRNPNSFLSKIFRRGSSTELNSLGLQANSYSWYRPSIVISKEIVIKTSDLVLNIDISEFLKITNFDNVINTNKDSLIFGPTTGYSHSLSSTSFGQFLNNLLIKFPNWLKKDESSNYSSDKQYPISINCKFHGEQLISLAHSHWLAQESKMDKKWKHLLCAEFESIHNQSGDFLKICQELELLTILVDIAGKQDHDPIKLICSSFNNKYSDNRQNNSGQMSIFGNLSSEHGKHILFKRIVLNLSEIPKKNPHHYVLSSILKHKEQLLNDGLLYILTNQNLFVPSQSEKMEQFLKILKLEAYFNFDELTGKGEIPSFLYIFSLRNESPSYQDNNLFDPRGLNSQFEIKEKEPCLSFRWSGQLKTFSKFGLFVETLTNFFNEKSPSTSTIYIKSLENDLSFELHQDAIMDGKLLHSTSKDPSNVTHPSFFKNLTTSCIPFDHFFQLEQVSPSANGQQDTLTSGLLGISYSPEDLYPLVLIANYTDSQNIKLEIIPSKSYQAKAEELGHAFYSYFGLIPKSRDLNINMFRDFFKSHLGSQIVQICLTGGATKVKSKLKSLLIPKFFSETKPIPTYLESTFDILKLAPDEIKSENSSKLLEEFNRKKESIKSIVSKYPWHGLGLLCYFKYNLSYLIENQNQAHSFSADIDFNNPNIYRPLIEKNKSPLYPNNQDVYLELKISSVKEIQSYYHSSKIVHSEDELYLEILSHEKSVARLYSDKEMLQFIHFILGPVQNATISQIFSSVEVPSLKDLKEVIKKSTQNQEDLKILYKDTIQIINQLLSSQISLSS